MHTSPYLVLLLPSKPIVEPLVATCKWLLPCRVSDAPRGELSYPDYAGA